MKRLFLFSLLCFSASIGKAQKPKDGTYTFKIAFAEQQGQSMGETCTVKIKGDSIKIIYDGKGSLSNAKKGTILDEGVIMKHKSGIWIIGKNKKDKYMDEVGGCTSGPSEIDFKKKLFWLC